MAISSAKPIQKSHHRILEVSNISKSFPGVQALDDVSFHLNEGEILAILGENGAGKSTLMKILAGLYRADTGTVRINPDWFETGISSEILENIKIRDPRMAMKLGIGMVYQHFKLVERFSVADNIILGKEFTRGQSIFLDDDAANNQLRNLSEAFGLPIDPTAIVKDLPVGLKQRVEILKQLYRDAQLLILDEPTAVLTPTETVELFNTIQKLRDDGKAIIFITHKLREPLAIADRIIVLRKGKFVGEILPKDATEEKLAEMVVGTRVIKQIDRKDIEPGKAILKINKLEVEDRVNQQLVVKDASFEIHEHEILGIAGVQGNGQSELVEAIIGLLPTVSGSIEIEYNNKFEDVTNYPTIKRLNMDLGFIPEDRMLRGLILDFSLTENVWMGYFGHPEEDYVQISDEGKEESSLLSKISSRLFIPFQMISKFTSKIVKEYNVQTSSINELAKNLSGGNQQKIILGRELSKDPRLLIASEPTRGVDIGVMTRIHKELIERRNEGTAVLLVSSDLDEILTLSDRIAIMYEGEIVAIKATNEYKENEISQLMTRGANIQEEKL